MNSIALLMWMSGRCDYFKYLTGAGLIVMDLARFCKIVSPSTGKEFPPALQVPAQETVSVTRYWPGSRKVCNTLPVGKLAPEFCVCKEVPSPKFQSKVGCNATPTFIPKITVAVVNNRLVSLQKFTGTCARAWGSGWK